MSLRDKVRPGTLLEPTAKGLVDGPQVTWSVSRGGHSEGAGLDPENMRGRRWSGPEPPMFFINSFISDFK